MKPFNQNDYNHVIASGTVKGTPEVVDQQKGRVVKLLLESKQDISDTQPHTEWFYVVCPPPLSREAAHLVAGNRVMVLGSLRAKDGGPSKMLLANSFQLLK